MNALKNCAKTAAKINVPKATQLDEFQHFCSGYLEFYTDRARPPSTAPSSAHEQQHRWYHLKILGGFAP